MSQCQTRLTFSTFIFCALSRPSFFSISIFLAPYSHSFIYLFFSPQMYNNIIKHTLKFQIVINRKLKEYTQKKEPRAPRLV